ncbi:GAF domain-containing protein, partial [bacterium]
MRDMEIRIPPEAVGLSVADADLTQLTRAVVPMPINERERVEALHRFEILDSSAEERFDELARLAALICNAPIAVISFLDRHRQWFKARVGIESRGTPREHAFCSYTILNPGEVMQVPDARLDPRFAANPMVSTEAGIRFYAGAPLLSSDGEAIGTLCVVDKEPRELRPDQLQALRSLAAQVVAQLELRLALREVERRRRALELAHDELAHDNLTDALTGVPNRRAFDDRLQREVARCGV